jgi:hypothetical protein
MILFRKEQQKRKRAERGHREPPSIFKSSKDKGHGDIDSTNILQKVFYRAFSRPVQQFPMNSIEKKVLKMDYTPREKWVKEQEEGD